MGQHSPRRLQRAGGAGAGQGQLWGLCVVTQLGCGWRNPVVELLLQLLNKTGKYKSSQIPPVAVKRWERTTARF